MLIATEAPGEADGHICTILEANNIFTEVLAFRGRE